MLTEHDFQQAYGPMLQKWEAKLGKPELTELMNDIVPAVQGLLVKTAGHQTALGATPAHTDVIHGGIKTFEAFRKKHGY